MLVKAVQEDTAKSFYHHKVIINERHVGNKFLFTKKLRFAFHCLLQRSETTFLFKCRLEQPTEYKWEIFVAGTPHVQWCIKI